MRDFIYMIWAAILGVAAYFTGEIVTFVMLGLILLALNTISKHLSEIKVLFAEKNQNKIEEK